MYHTSSQNLQHHLWIRESNLKPERRHSVPHRFLFHEKNFYKSITPRLTVQNVDKPNCFLRKFTPNGQLLLTFSQDQRSLDVYQYQGIGSVAHLVGQQSNECITAADHSSLSLHIRHQLFGNLFKKKFNIPIIKTPITSRHVLSRDFSIFMDDGNYVLLASMVRGYIFPDYASYRQYLDLSDDAILYDYTFYLVDLRQGCIADTLKLEHDFLVLSHNHNVSIYDRTLGILSTYRQCIELIELNVTIGKLHRLFIVGPFESDLARNRNVARQRDINIIFNPLQIFPLSEIKQKILASMYREIMDLNSMSERQEELREFYKNFAEVENMMIIKMQLMDSDHILLRYEKRQTLMYLELIVDSVDPLNQNFELYVFYNIPQEKILKVCKKNSMELLQILRNYSDEFRSMHPLQIPWITSSPSNNIFLRAAFDQALNSFSSGIAEAAASFNPTLPINSQCFSISPYLDYSMFNYDDRLISSLERPRLNSLELEHIRFYDRDTGILKFRVFLEQASDTRHDEFECMYNSRNLVSFIFHPYEPFFISIQEFISRYVINFHMYNSSTAVIET